MIAALTCMLNTMLVRPLNIMLQRRWNVRTRSITHPNIREKELNEFRILWPLNDAVSMTFLVYIGPKMKCGSFAAQRSNVWGLWLISTSSLSYFAVHFRQLLHEYRATGLTINYTLWENLHFIITSATGLKKFVCLGTRWVLIFVAALAHLDVRVLSNGAFNRGSNSLWTSG